MINMLPQTRTIEKKMIQSLFAFFADETNGAVSGLSQGILAVRPKFSHKSNLHMERTNRLGYGKN